MTSDLNDHIAVACDWCDDTCWIMRDYEKESHGFIYAPCPKCSWLPRAQPSIPAPVDVLALMSESKRIALGEDEAWRQHDQNKRRG